MPPTKGNGKICYIELPTTDVSRSADFYKSVFGWNIRTRTDGSTSFDDTVGEVSGSFVVGRQPSPGAPGMLVYIMVADAVASVDAIARHGGKIVQPIGGDAPEITARFTDPAGNLFGIYQSPSA
ncbi:MAG: VOC family protein [Gemmatimonadaceae bacterium]